MPETQLKADYLIVGAGAVGMAFADTLLTETSASMVIVDRRHKPGGHWNDAYPFIRLHAPSSYYGVNSARLGSDRLEETGLNSGLYELATGAEICAYFDQIMRQRLLPSGRVTYLPLSDFGDDGVVTSRLTGARTRIDVRKKLVDATFADTRLPATHAPAYSVSPGARLVSPADLVRLREPCAGFTVIGAGKTAIDTVIWLLEQGTDPEHITWVRPRDPWLLNRKNLQRSFDFFSQTFGAFAAEMEAARDATSINDLFARLEAAELLVRIDRNVTPTMYRCAIISDMELAQLRRVANVVRMGHITAIEPDRITLEQGVVETSPRQLHINCSADGIPRRPAEPIFQPGRIVPQYVRRCSPTFSGAFVAHLEAALADDEEKNALSTPVPAPREPLDWLSMHVQDGRTRAAWAKYPELQQWLMASRLDGFTAMTARVMREALPEQTALMQRYKAAIHPGLARLGELLQGADKANG